MGNQVKIHINPKSGKTGVCTAKPGNCKYGEQTLHYASEADAMKAFELSMEGQTFANTKKCSENTNLDKVTFTSVESAVKRMSESDRRSVQLSDTIVRDWYWEAREKGLNHAAAYDFALGWDEHSDHISDREDYSRKYIAFMDDYLVGIRKPHS